MNNFLLDFLALGAILSGILVITSKNPVISVLFLISVFVNVAGYLVLLGVGFIGISYLIVYIGAVTVLFLFVIMMLNLQLTELSAVGNEYTQNLPLATIIGSLLLFELVSVVPSFDGFYQLNSTATIFKSLGVGILNWFNSLSLGVGNTFAFAEVNQTFNSFAADTQFATFLQIQSIGQVLYTNGALWLIVSSLILLLAMVGPITLSMNKKDSSPFPSEPESGQYSKSSSKVTGKRFYSSSSRSRLPGDHFRRHNLVKKLFAEKSTALNTKENLEMALGISISQETIDLCMAIVQNSVTCDLPYANTEASKAFSLIAGPHTTKDPAKRKAGCYHIHDNIDNVFGSGYVGQSIALVNRVREHANNRFSTTSSYITSLNKQGKVTLYLVPDSYNLSLDIATFLTILERSFLCSSTISQY